MKEKKQTGLWTISTMTSIKEKKNLYNDLEYNSEWFYYVVSKIEENIYVNYKDIRRKMFHINA